MPTFAEDVKYGVTGPSNGKLEIRKRWKDLALYVLICAFGADHRILVFEHWYQVGIFVQAIAIADVSDSLTRNSSARAPPQWRSKRFWMALGLTLLIHAILFVILASRIEILKPAVTGIIAVPEYLLWMLIDQWIGEVA